jgi:hypothetical protein
VKTGGSCFIPDAQRLPTSFKNFNRVNVLRQLIPILLAMALENPARPPIGLAAAVGRRFAKDAAAH